MSISSWFAGVYVPLPLANTSFPCLTQLLCILPLKSFTSATWSHVNLSPPFFSEMLTNFKEIESEGVDIDGNDLWVQSYVVSISNDSARGWMDHENGVAQEVSGNKNGIWRWKIGQVCDLSSDLRSFMDWARFCVPCSKVAQNAAKYLSLFFPKRKEFLETNSSVLDKFLISVLFLSFFFIFVLFFFCVELMITTSPPTQHHSFFRNCIPFIRWSLCSSFLLRDWKYGSFPRESATYPQSDLILENIILSSQTMYVFTIRIQLWRGKSQLQEGRIPNFSPVFEKTSTIATIGGQLFGFGNVKKISPFGAETIRLSGTWSDSEQHRLCSFCWN